MRNNKINFYLIILLLVLGLGIGYAVLTQQLTINNTINYGSMKWDVGFTSAVDGDGSVTSTPYISTDKKVITVTCDLGKSTSAETCIVNATITNGSTFDIMLKDFPTLTYDNTYINSVDLIWMDSLSALTKYNFVGTGKSKDLQIKVNTKELSVEMLPEEPLSITITILMDWVEADSNVNSIVYDVGHEISIANEKFNVISDNGKTVTMFSKYGIDDTYRQSDSATNGRFSNTNGWPFRPGPLEIDFQSYGGTAATKVNEYVNYLQTETGDTTLTGTLMTMTELKPLGCTISDDYSYIADLTCANSEHADWLLNGQTWWTRSAFYQGNMIWLVKDTGLIFMGNGSSNEATIRPVITISKSAISS